MTQVSIIDGKGVALAGSTTVTSVGIKDYELQWFSDMFVSNAGVYSKTANNSMQVTATGTLNLIVKPGVANVENSDWGFADGVNTKFFNVFNSSNVTVTVPTTVSNNRKDRINLVVDPAITPNVTASNVPSFEVVTGTEASSPALPTNPADGKYRLELATLDLTHPLSSISQANITDTRVETSQSQTQIENNTLFRGYLGTSQAGIGTGAPTLIEIDTESYDKGNNFNTGTHKYTVPVAGIYGIYAVFLITGPTVDDGFPYFASIFVNGVEEAQNLNQGSKTGDPLSVNVNTEIQLSQGDLVDFRGETGIGAGPITLAAGTINTYLQIKLLSI